MKLRWKNHAIIECEGIEDRGPIIILENGLIRYEDGSTSRFDRLLLTRDEVEEQYSRQKNRGRRKT